MNSRSVKFVLLLIGGLMLFNIASPLLAQDISPTEKALRNALIEICYGSRVVLDLNDPAKSEVSLKEAELDDETIAAIVADAAQTDGSYEALSNVLIAHCLGEDVLARLLEVMTDRGGIDSILVEAGVKDTEAFFIQVNEYVIFEQYIITYFESYSFTEEQYAAIFFTMEFGTSVELNSLLVEFGVDTEAAEAFVDYTEDTIDEIESEDSPDEDEDGILNIEDTDDDNDGTDDAEDEDDDGNGVDDEDEDDDIDNDGIDDDEDDDADGDGIDDEEDEDTDGDGVDDDDADSDGVEDEEDTDDDGDGVEDAEDGDDDGDGQDEPEDDSMMGDDDGGGEDGGEDE